MIKLIHINFLALLLIINSCETVSDLSNNIVSGDNVEVSSGDGGELLSDDFGSDPTLEEILADAENTIDDLSSQESVSIEPSSEKLPPAPTTEYDTSLIDQESDIKNETLLENSQEQIAELSTKEENVISPSPSVESFESTYQRSALDLNDQIQYRVATINFNSGSSTVNYSGLKKIKKIAKIAKERNAKIKIIGHASERTKDMPIAKHKVVNFIISDKRANSVAEIFIKKYNFPMEKLITQGLSDSRPLFKEIMPAGTKANQRTEIFLIY